MQVIEWIVSPGDKTYFHPCLIATIEEGFKFCKKDAITKRNEITEAMEKPLCESIANNPKLWLQGGHTGLCTAAILKLSKGDHCRNAFESLAKLISDPEWTVLPVEENEVSEKKETVTDNAVAGSTDVKIKKRKIVNPIEADKPVRPIPVPVCGIEHAGLHVALKKLGKNDSEKIKSNEPSFGEALVQHLTDETIVNWLPLNRACFFLITIYENGNEYTQNQLMLLLKKHKKLLSQQKHAGSKILKQKLGI